MNRRGTETRRLILKKSYPLFAEKGFKEVTMKDICECTGLSRGGLYRHYDSTSQIFAEILEELLKRQEMNFQKKSRRRNLHSVFLTTFWNVTAWKCWIPVIR